MKVTAREFLRDFARMKAKASSGQIVQIVSRGEEFIFQAVKSRTWQGAMKGKIKIKGSLFSTGIQWDAY
jgi:hypothetical protein